MIPVAFGPVILGAVFLTSCQTMPETYAPPVQRQPFENFRPYRELLLVDLGTLDADSHIVRDIPKDAQGSWRWTGQHPAVQVSLRSVMGVTYVIDFSLADATLKDTGPVTITFDVNGHELGAARYSAPGPYHFENAVPSEWVEAGKQTIVGASIDKMWVSPTDGVKLGFILTHLGLRQEEKDSSQSDAQTSQSDAKK
jgi:hypothetical protein